MHETGFLGRGASIDYLRALAHDVTGGPDAVHAIDISHSESVRSGSQTPGDSDRPDTLETLVLPSALLGVATQPSQVPDVADGGVPDQPTGASADATIDEPAAAADATPGDQGSLGLRRISHDIHHELATITVLASVLVHAPD